jgi:hypothetical protein
MSTFIDITPKRFRCGDWGGCPAVFAGDDDTYHVIGTTVPADRDMPHLEGRVGPGEVTVKISKDLLEAAVRKVLEREKNETTQIR